MQTLAWNFTQSLENTVIVIIGGFSRHVHITRRSTYLRRFKFRPFWYQLKKKNRRIMKMLDLNRLNNDFAPKNPLNHETLVAPTPDHVATLFLDLHSGGMEIK